MLPGRSVAGMDKRFGGINELCNVLNVKQGAALDMLDFEIDPTDALKRRDGMSLQSVIGTKLRFGGSYYTVDGTQVFVAVCDNKFWEALSPAGPWTDRTGGVTLSDVDGPWVGVDMNGKFILTNGTDAPVYHSRGANLQTIKNASLVPAPSGLSISQVGAISGASPYTWAITSLTPRGESLPAYFINQNITFASLNTSNYLQLTWNQVAGASGYNIYRAVSGGVLTRIATLTTPSTISYNDQSQTYLLGNPPVITGAYNTPSDWDFTPPRCFGIMARGRAQRALACCNGKVFASALSDPLTWLTASDAFDQPVYGGKDNNVVAIGTLYDYTLLCTKTNTFVYSGSTSSDFALSKILNVGCVSPHSMISAQDNLFFWSEVGPNSFARVMQGQDIQTTPGMNNMVQNTVSSLSNRSYWSKIVAWNHLRNNRLAWAYPNGTSSDNNRALVYSYSGDPTWSRHSTPAVVNAVTDTLRFNYIFTSDGRVYKLYDGNDDAGVPISGFYETGWYDTQSFLSQRMNWFDLVVDKTTGAYNLSVDIFWDMATTSSFTHSLTETSTDGIPLAITTPTANIHRIFTRGVGKLFKIRVSVASYVAPLDATAPRILGWRPEKSDKGTR